jgi:nucleoside-diphosphate-sugar epimerase
VNWRLIGPQISNGTIQHWICLAPIWVLSDYFELMERCGIRRIVALSSTSRFTKGDSSVEREKETVSQLVAAEKLLAEWAGQKGIEWTILRPTLIYGLGRDSNISEIARLIRRYRFFPLFGAAQGLRQPVYAGDVAQACMAALVNPQTSGRSYNISGGEILPYRAMVARVFTALGSRPRFIQVPKVLFHLVVMVLRLFPRYGHWSAAMAERMNLDMVFDHSEASRDLGFTPKGFDLSARDLPAG